MSLMHSLHTNHSTHHVADQYGLPYLLAAVRQQIVVDSKMQQQACPLTFSVDEVAEAFFDDLLRVPELLDQYRFHMDHRQYANELLLLEYFRSSPCRIRGGGGKGGGTAMTMTMMMKAADDTKTKNSSKKKIMNELNSSTKQAPHYYIIFIPFKNLLGLSRPVTPDQNSRLTSILDRVFSSKTFMFDREHYLYIYTATFHFENHFIAHLHKDFHKLLDHRVVRLGRYVSECVCERER